MEDIKIFFSDDKYDAYIETECIERGFRGGIIVQINEEYYSVFCLTLQHLTNMFNYYVIEQGETYYLNNNAFLVKECSRDEIIKTILIHYKKGYFNYFQPFDVTNIDFDNYLQVY